MRKASIALAFLLTAVLLPAGTAFGWGSATHAYIGHELRAQAGPVDLDEVYGSMAPDLFTFLFADPNYDQLEPLVPYLYGLTHGDGAAVRGALRHGWEKAELYGFLGHSELRGADRTAHLASLTLDPAEGYIITKARALNAILMTIPAYADLGLSDAAALEVCHNLVESAGDLIIADASPRVGKLMVASATRPAQPLRGLLVRAWSPGLMQAGMTPAEAEAFIVGWEGWFRSRVASFGWLLQQPPPAPFNGVVQDFAALATAYLASLGYPAPPQDTLEMLIAYGIVAAANLCRDDYLPEVEETIEYTSLQLRRFKALQKAR
jgi:hypothetical protein